MQNQLHNPTEVVRARTPASLSSGRGCPHAHNHTAIIYTPLLS